MSSDHFTTQKQDENQNGSGNLEVGTVPKDLVSLPRPLSMMDLATLPSDHFQVGVAYQGVPRAYSEIATLKAYPQCDVALCEPFEVLSSPKFLGLGEYLHWVVPLSKDFKI